VKNNEPLTSGFVQLGLDDGAIIAIICSPGLTFTIELLLLSSTLVMPVACFGTLKTSTDKKIKIIK
jgi:hypothetical protein